jgi:hypothetical protein
VGTAAFVGRGMLCNSEHLGQRKEEDIIVKVKLNHIIDWGDESRY